MRQKWSAVTLGVTLAVAGCSEPKNETARSVSTDAEVLELQPADESVARQAVEVLAEHLNVPIADIEVDTVRAVNWRDTSIGCPQPDEAYLQVITPGHKITLRVDGRFHTVHEASGRAFVCKTRKPSVGGLTEKLDLEWGPMAVLARKDLAAQLGIGEDAIIVASSSGTSWTDTSLGCPEPGVEYPERRVEGYVIRLRYGSRDYSYHTDLDRVIACPAFSVD